MRTNDIFTTTYSPGSDPLRSLDGRTAHVKGLRPFEDAQAVATAACGAATNHFDVVGLGDFAVTGLCGCRSASDATDSDSDAPTAETMDLVLVTETGCEVLTEKAKEDK